MNNDNNNDKNSNNNARKDRNDVRLHIKSHMFVMHVYQIFV